MAMAEQLSYEIIDWATRFEETKFYDFSEVADLFQEEIENADIELPSGKVHYVDRFGGEGKGEEYWVVFSLEDQLFRFEGYWSSWEGVSWVDAEVEEVEAEEVTVIKYKKKK